MKESYRAWKNVDKPHLLADLTSSNRLLLLDV
jgi:hypothetical protein